MHAPIVVNYVADGDNWAITVAQDEQQRTGKAAGLIAARDRADQLVAQLAPNQASRTVVHLLDGDAYAFTTSYLQERLGIHMAPTESAEPVAGQPAESGEPGDVVAAPAAETVVEPAGDKVAEKVVDKVAEPVAVVPKQHVDVTPADGHVIDSQAVDVQTGTLPLQAG